MVEQPCSVYFMGADSTGKSELVKYVARAYGMRKVRDGAQRPSRGELPRRNKACACATWMLTSISAWCFDRQIAQESAAARPFVADRLDNLAYQRVRGDVSGELAAREEVRSTSRRSLADVVFLVRSASARAQRTTCACFHPEEQQALDAKIELCSFGVPRGHRRELAARRKNRLIGASLRGVHETWMSKSQRPWQKPADAR